jgi:hypothetical protein
MLDLDEKYQQVAEDYKALMNFEEKRSGQDLHSYINYLAKHDQQHLRGKYGQITQIEMYDFDMVGIITCFTTFILFKIVKKLLY